MEAECCISIIMITDDLYGQTKYIRNVFKYIFKYICDAFEYIFDVFVLYFKYSFFIRGKYYTFYFVTLILQL